MTAPEHASHSAVPATELRSAIQQELRRVLSSHATISHLHRRPSPYRSSFALEELDVTLEGGSTLELMIKHTGPDALQEEARVAKPRLLCDPLREIEVYRGLLATAPLGTANYYGSAVDETNGSHWLLVERVRGVELYQVGDLTLWKEASRWLAKAHARFAELGPTAASGRLIAHDDAYFRGWIGRASEFARNGPDVKRRSIEALAPAYDRAVECLLAVPPTVIHGEFYASNVLIARPPDPPRVCPIDWEVAGFGPGVIDLAALTTGWGGNARRAMELAYWAALRPPYEWSGSQASFAEAVDHARLFLAVRWLGWAPWSWTPPVEHRHDWLREARALADRIGA